MNVLFLSPHFPTQFWLFCAALKDEGATVLAIGDTPAHDLRPELRDALAAYVHLPSLEDRGAVEQATSELIRRQGRIDRIDSLNEHWLVLEAGLREAFDVWGPRPEEIHRLRSKSFMRERFRSANVPCTEGERFESAAQVRAFVRRHGFPVVLKPDAGVGAARTFQVDTWESLESALQADLTSFVVERFEPGTLASYDGLIDREGRVVFAISHLFSSGVMQIVNERRTPWYYSRRDVPPELDALGRRIVAAFGLRERCFHIEFFVQPGGFRALELNVRPPGGFTTDMMNWSCDVDVYRLWAKAVVGRDLSTFTFERKFHVAHVGRRAELRYRLSHDALVTALGPSLVAHRTLPHALAGAMGDDVYLLRDPDEASLRERIALVAE